MTVARFLSITEAAQYLGLSVSTVRRYISRGDIVLCRLPNGTPRIDRVALERLIVASPKISAPKKPIPPDPAGPDDPTPIAPSDPASTRTLTEGRQQ